MRRIDEFVLEGVAVLRLAADDISTQQRKPRIRNRISRARDGDRGSGPSPWHEPTGSGTQEIVSLPFCVAFDGRNGADNITYIPMADGRRWRLLIGRARAVLAWRLSNTMDTATPATHWTRLWSRHGKPRFNTNQGAQFTSAAFSRKLRRKNRHQFKLRYHSPMGQIKEQNRPVNFNGHILRLFVWIA